MLVLSLVMHLIVHEMILHLEVLFFVPQLLSLSQIYVHQLKPLLYSHHCLADKYWQYHQWIILESANKLIILIFLHPRKYTYVYHLHLVQ